MSPLEQLIRRRIELSGPISVADFMALAMNCPEHGYYANAAPPGRKGDFTTSPEISQVFGELIGLWAGVAWQQMGSPRPVLFVEFGPGRGTMMRDMLRSARLVDGFRDSLEVHVVETSSALKQVQRQTLAEERISWHASVDDLPDFPAIMVANEFLDALPMRQLVRTVDGWKERRVENTVTGFRFVLEAREDAAVLVPPRLRDAEPGAIFEVAEGARGFAIGVARHITSTGGTALLIDYGHDSSALGETLQAVQHHASTDVLENAGEADLSAHVDFEQLEEELRFKGATPYGPVSQRQFLRRLGIEERTEALAAAAPLRAAEIRAATKRLIDPRQMGTLFKVLAATAPGAAAPAGFES